MNVPSRAFVALSAVALIAASLPAHAQVHRGGGWGGGAGWSGHRHGGPGPWRGGIGIGLGVGLGLGLAAPYSYGSVWAPAWGPGYVVVDRPVVRYEDAPPVAQRDVAPAPPEPVIYPRNGQSAAQTEADRQDCNRWATTQPSAVLDASVFQRATFACLEGRGYSVR